MHKKRICIICDVFYLNKGNSCGNYEKNDYWLTGQIGMPLYSITINILIYQAIELLHCHEMSACF